MSRLAHAFGYLLSMQVFTGFLMGPAIAFGRVYGYQGFLTHLANGVLALCIYGVSLYAAGRGGNAASRAMGFRLGLFATLLFCIVGTAVLTSGRTGLAG